MTAKKTIRRIAPEWLDFAHLYRIFRNYIISREFFQARILGRHACRMWYAEREPEYRLPLNLVTR